MASDDPKRQDAAPPQPSPAAIEEAVARLSPPGTVDEPLPSPEDETLAAASEPPAPAEPAPQPPPPPAQKTGPSPWLALPIGAVAGALASAMVAYGLVETGMLKPAPSGDLQPLLQRLSALEARPRQDLAPSVAQLDSRVAKLEASGLQQALAATQAEIAGLKQSVQALSASATQSAAQSATLAQQLAGISTQTETLSKNMDEVAEAATALDRATATLAVLGALKDAIFSGRPFAAELDAARAVLGPTAGSLDPFVQDATQGYPLPAKLAERLAEAARAAPPREPEAVPPGGSFMDRIISSAESLVKVKPADAVVSPDQQAAVQRAVSAVRAGDLDLALKEIDAMSPEMKARLKEIATEIAERRDAANTASALYQQALAAISGKVP